ncbi:MAG: 4-alpha-glucanotransferase [Alphaproteobacteria bacterium]|nr:4-alpha-glucanotransferase [Alphaproteobacteria bacterium]
MSELLKELASKLNIATNFTYAGGSKEAVVSDEVLKFFIESFGYKASNNGDIVKSLERVAKLRWQRAMEACYIVNEDDKKFSLVINEEEENGDIEVLVSVEGRNEYVDVYTEFEEVDRRKGYVLFEGNIISDLGIGYYDLKVVTNKQEYKAMLAVAPKRCYELDKKGKEKLFGFSVQLYSLKSKRNWGIGDFSDLENFISMAGRVGGDVIGLNPLSVLNNDYPESASPYNSVSRLFLNPIYIDIEKVPYYEECWDKSFDVIASAKGKEKISYAEIYGAKVKALKNIFDRVKKDTNSWYYKDFEVFKKNEGVELYRLAVFTAIRHERFLRNENVSSEWKKTFYNVLNPEVEKFANERSEEIEFYMFMQFEADRQLKAVKNKIDESNMAIGLYRDLPVGVSRDSAEVWGDNYLYMQECGAGAPPDNYFPTGQKWGLGAFNPYELKERCYKPFIRILRANMKYAGALRVDHVMGLSRLYIIPDKLENGTYIRYNEKDMLNILALESHLNKCMVAGECIGNVESGFEDMLEEKNIYRLGVLWSERYSDGLTLKKPEEYAKKYFASVGTHDMPPLKAWWFGREIQIMKDLGLFSDENARNAYSWREEERRNILKGLDMENIWPDDRRRCQDYIYGENYPEGIEEAVNAYMAKSNSEVFMLQLEDMFHQTELQNLPGTDMEHPNWRTRVPVDMENMECDIGWIRNIATVKKYRF